MQMPLPAHLTEQPFASSDFSFCCWSARTCLPDIEL